MLNLTLIYLNIGLIFAYVLLFAPEWIREFLLIEVRINGREGSLEEKAEVAIRILLTWPMVFSILFLSADE